jgi:hypothetical protein
MHSKAPWSFDLKDSDNEFIHSAEDELVAEVIAEGCTPEEFQANCNLIVRAPALFKALEAWAFADADPEAARRKGYYDRAREQRDALLRQLGSKAVRP